ncbi:unnamed protein product, partial [Prorocentrum cordatum]
AASVSARQAELYHQHSRMWAEGRCDFFDMRSLDVTFERFFAHLYQGGCNLLRARQALRGSAFVHGLSVARSDFPCARRAPRGFGRQALGRECDPMPWGARQLISADLLGGGRALEEQHAGAALVLQFDLYARPSEVLELVGSPIAVGHASQPSGVIVRPADDVGEGSAIEQARACAGLQRARPAKSGERQVSLAANRLRLQWLRLAPHSVRRGGPGEDCFGTFRDIAAIQSR